MQIICKHCNTVLMNKSTNKYKTIFTCRKPNCPNYNKDVLLKKMLIKA